MDTKYFFVTKWKVKAPLNEVWDAIYNSLEWPNWWHGVLAVEELKKGDEYGIGSIRKYTMKSMLPYKLIFNTQVTKRKDFSYLAGIASGELEGEGQWFFKEENYISCIEYHWQVTTKKNWMNWFAFILKPIFKYNHNIIMQWGAKGLAKKLNAALISY